MKSFLQFLAEKLIIVGDGEPYGQIIFLAGGGGSGKGFVVQNMIDARNFKIRDVDEMKLSLIKLDHLMHDVQHLPDCQPGMKKTGESDHHLICNPFHNARGLDLRKPGDVFALHQAIDDLGWKEKTLDILLGGAKQGKLPNILFDITAKSPNNIKSVIGPLLNVGYQPENINLIWVLANYRVAVSRNAKRSRVVPEDVLLQTHEGAANTMYSILNGAVPKGMNGGIYVVLSRDLKKDPDPSKSDYYADGKTIKNFDYVKVKSAGKSMEGGSWHEKINQWIVDNIPKTELTAHIFDKKLGEETIYPKNSLGLARHQMPQIRSFDVLEFLQFLGKHGVKQKKETVLASSLKPSQKEINGDKARGAVIAGAMEKPLLVSKDDYIMDGHHRWQNAVWNKETLPIIRLSVNIHTLLSLATTFPKAETATLDQYHQPVN